MKKLIKSADGAIANIIVLDGDNLPDWALGLQDAAEGHVIGMVDDGQGVFSLPAPPAPVGADVNAERDRRITAGVDIVLAGRGSIALQGRQRDQIALLGLKDAALLRIQGGDVSTVTKFRDRENVIHELTPPQVVDLWMAGAAWLQAIYEASWALKPDDGTPIPADFADDLHWP